ncbi:MAG: hypothetical protein NTW03_14585 [Verrucomicrobia bacterium]|nr:hypothetical protein [Verrucomicrobiota bacterium]
MRASARKTITEGRSETSRHYSEDRGVTGMPSRTKDRSILPLALGELAPVEIQARRRGVMVQRRA